MKPLTVLTYPAPSLKKPSIEVQKVDSRIQDLVQAMFETMYLEQGIGLAAPQVGENINLFVMDVGRPNPLDPEKSLPHKICMINPKILSATGEIEYEEGCLSCPDLLVKVDRAAEIVVVSLDMDGRQQTLSLNELEAVCTQHEMDHLKGILLVDKLSRLKREVYGKQRVREKKSELDKSLIE
jgi:peptide deformylase